MASRYRQHGRIVARALLLVGLVLSGLSTAGAFDPERSRGFVTMTHFGTRSRPTSVIEIGRLGQDDEQRAVTFWAKRSDPKRPDERFWTDSTRCSTLPAVVAGLGTVQLPKPFVPAYVPPDGLEMITVQADGGGHALELAGQNEDGSVGEVKLADPLDQTVRRWIDRAEIALAPCWSPTPPQ